MDSISERNVFFFESMGQYWIPIFNIFYDSNLELILVKPQYIKILSCEEVQQLRLRTRRRKAYTKGFLIELLGVSQIVSFVILSEIGPNVEV